MRTITAVVVPFLASRFPAKDASALAAHKPAIPASPQILSTWASATATLMRALPPAQLFPLVDMWRLAVLDESVAAWLASGPSSDPLALLLNNALELLDGGDGAAKTAARSFMLTFLRLLANGFAHTALAKTLLSRGPGGRRAEATRAVVSALLVEDGAVRTAAASVVFDVAAALQRSRVEHLRGVVTGQAPLDVEEDGEWEVGLVCAVLEAIRGEVQSEEVGEWKTARKKPEGMADTGVCLQFTGWLQRSHFCCDCLRCTTVSYRRFWKCCSQRRH